MLSAARSLSTKLAMPLSKKQPTAPSLSKKNGSAPVTKTLYSFCHIKLALPLSKNGSTFYTAVDQVNCIHCCLFLRTRKRKSFFSYKYCGHSGILPYQTFFTAYHPFFNPVNSLHPIGTKCAKLNQRIEYKQHMQMENKKLDHVYF